MKDSLHKKDIKKCIGYEDDDKNVRLYLICSDDHHYYLMEYVVDGEMEQPFFYREISTRKKEIPQPDFIESLNYQFWQ